MNKSRFDLRAMVSLTCTVDGEEKQLSVLLDGIVRQADDSIGMFYDDLCEQVSWKLPHAHAKAFLEEAEKQYDGLCEDWMLLVPDLYNNTRAYKIKTDIRFARATLSGTTRPQAPSVGPWYLKRAALYCLTNPATPGWARLLRFALMTTDW